MKTRQYKRRRDGVKQHYWVGRTKASRKRKFHMGWAKGVDNTNPNFMDGDWEEGGEKVYEKRRILMDPDVFLKRQYEQSGERVSFEEWVKGNPRQLERAKQGLLDPNVEVPVPLEEYTPEGVRKDFQEGRHRGLAAKELGMKVPVIQGRKKFAPWDRAAPDKPFEHRPASFYKKKEGIINRWEAETGMFEEDKE